MASKVIIAPSSRPHLAWGDQGGQGDIIVRSGVYLDGLEVLTCCRDDGQVKPLMIFYHGYTQNNFSNMQVLYDLARQGCYVVAPEIGGHGARQREKQLPMWALLQQTLGEVERLIKALKDQPLLDGSKIGLAGVSFGAVVTYHYLIWGKEKVQVAASMSGTPDLVSLLGQPLGFLTPDQGAGLAAFVPPSSKEKTEALAWAEAFSALVHWPMLAEVPLLMLHGNLDEAVSPRGEGQLYDLLEASDLGQDLVYQIFDQVGHEGNNQMRDALVDWFRDNLISGKI